MMTISRPYKIDDTNYQLFKKNNQMIFLSIWDKSFAVIIKNIIREKINYREKKRSGKNERC
ncbi:MAG: hypothetical protein ACFFHV_13725 [Promethearchaeota archaeon]